MEFPQRRTIRLQGYDYSSNGVYFVTICTHQRIELFGSINQGKMELNQAGKMVVKWINKIDKKYMHTQMDRYIIMPHHIHFIIQIVGARSSRPINHKNLIGRDNPAPTLGQIIGWFKYQSTKDVNKMNNTGTRKLWQRNYYEHIIRNEKEYYAVIQYMEDNPKNWGNDNNFM